MVNKELFEQLNTLQGAFISIQHTEKNKQIFKYAHENILKIEDFKRKIMNGEIK